MTRARFGVAIRPARAIALVIGGLGLWATYEIIDVWLDGALARWSRLRSPSA